MPIVPSKVVRTIIVTADDDVADLDGMSARLRVSSLAETSSNVRRRDVRPVGTRSPGLFESEGCRLGSVQKERRGIHYGS